MKGYTLSGLITEDTLHYAAAFLDRYSDNHKTAKHQMATKELRRISDLLLENLEIPVEIKVHRHKL